jgi:hypothetical protein
MNEAAYQRLLNDVPEGMSFQHIVGFFGSGRPEFMWSLANESGGVHICSWRPMGVPNKWYGGIEIHSPKQLYGDEPSKPDHEHCWLLQQPCWHDGTSLGFSETVASALPYEGLEFEVHHHAYVLSVLKNWHERHFPASGIEGEAGDPKGLHPEGESPVPPEEAADAQ